VRSPCSVIGSGQGIERPKVSDELDYEGELVTGIGKQGRHTSRADA
jgi:2-keto-4-pentenoate hydratase/2-oxohepta-3-ene-1,7-dioic acid hydratase in catechol pathway